MIKWLYDIFYLKLHSTIKTLEFLSVPNLSIILNGIHFKISSSCPKPLSNSTLKPLLSQEPVHGLPPSLWFNLYLLLAFFCQYLNTVQSFPSLKENKIKYDTTLSAVRSPPILSPRKACLHAGLPASPPLLLSDGDPPQSAPAAATKHHLVSEASHCSLGLHPAPFQQRPSSHSFFANILSPP